MTHTPLTHTISYKIVFIGAGNVATQLAKVFFQKKIRILQIYSKTVASAQQLANSVSSSYTTNIWEIAQNADIYILAVKDDELHNIIKQLPLKKQLVAHTSGSNLIDVFKENFDNYGVFYPLQTFTKERKVNWNNLPVCIEANNKANETKLIALAKTITDNVHIISSQQRQLLHLAAIFVCNFTSHMFTIAEDLLKKQGIPFELLQPLITETYSKICEHSPASIQTGPAVREDYKTMEQHIERLKENEEYQKVYQQISQSIIKSKNKQ